MPEVIIDPFDYRVLTETVSIMPRPKRLLSDLFVRGARNTHVTQTIDFDRESYGRRILPMVTNKQGGTIVGASDSEIRSVHPPRFRPKMQFPAADVLTQRTPGNPVYVPGGFDPSKALDAKINKNLARLMGDGENTIEFYLSMALRGGVIEVQQENLHYTVDYLMPDTHKVLLAKAWSDADSSPTSDLQSWSDLIGESYHQAPDVCVLGYEAAWAFENNAEVLKKLDNRRIESGLLSPAFSANFIGTYRGIQFYRYGGTVADQAGNVLNFFGPKDILLGCSESPTSIEFGLILDLAAKASVQAEYFSKTFEEGDPSALWLIVETRPLPMLKAPEAFVYARWA